MEQREKVAWIGALNEEDLAFLKRFLLASGSLKDLARAYDISYPTVRLRLDRLIAKVTVLENQEIKTEFERRIRAMYADARMDLKTMKEILNVHREEEAAYYEDGE